MSEPLILSVNVRIFQGQYGHAGINLEESFQLPAGMTFAEMSAVLQKFNDLAQTIKDARGKEK